MVAIAGCASKHAPKFADLPDASKPTAGTKPIVKASTALTGKVVSFNTVGRFAVLNFPVLRMPAIDQVLFVYREGLKVGEVKITGPQREDNIVADITAGEVKTGDEVRDR